jgi:hypothetical protein
MSVYRLDNKCLVPCKRCLYCLFWHIYIINPETVGRWREEQIIFGAVNELSEARSYGEGNE